MERYYRCNARWAGYDCHNNKRIKAERIEPLILAIVNDIMNIPNLIEILHANLSEVLDFNLDEKGARLKNLERELESLGKKKKNLISQVEEGNLKGEIVAERLKEIETRAENCFSEKNLILNNLKEHSDKLLELDLYKKVHAQFLDDFEQLSDDERRGIVKFHVQRISWYKDYAAVKITPGIGNLELKVKYLNFRKGELPKIVSQKNDSDILNKMGDGVTGSTTDSGSVCLGSIPSPPATPYKAIIAKKCSGGHVGLNELSSVSTPDSGSGNRGSSPRPAAMTDR